MLAHPQTGLRERPKDPIQRQWRHRAALSSGRRVCDYNSRLEGELPDGMGVYAGLK